MAVENLKSNAVTNLDAVPEIYMTAGEGAHGMMSVQTDYASPTAGGGSIGSTYRLARIPTTAKVKRVRFYTKGIDSNAAATAAFDINVAFSDDLNDGTPSGVQGTIPTTAGGGAVTTVAAYASPNKLFGTVTVANAGAAKETDVTYAGTFTPANALDDLWDVFGFVTAQGYAQDPGGYFDILAYLSTAAATPAAGTIGVEVDFVK